MATTTLPGSGKSFVTLTAGVDDVKALAKAIKSEFVAAGKHITADTVASGKAGAAGFFNVVFTDSSKKAVLTAGKGVQAIIANDKVSDTLIGGASTNLFVASAGGDSISTALTKGVATVFGGAGNDTVSVTGSADIYLEGGKNQVKLGSGDSVSLLGTGGKDTVAISGSKDFVAAAYGISVSVGKKSNDTLSLGAGKSTITLSTSDTINLIGAGAAVISAKGSATIIGGAGKLTFTGAAGAKDSIVAGAGAATLTAGKGADDLFKAGTGTGYVFNHGKGGSDTFVGGAHSDTMFGAGNDKTHTDIFEFESTLKGGKHTIENFTSGKDTIDLVGYSAAQVKAAIASGVFNAKTHTETITLSDKTTITVSGLTHKLTSSDIK